MPKAVPLVFVLLVTIGSISRATAQNSHIDLPPAVPQSQDLRVGVPKGDPSPGRGTTPTSSDEIFKQQAIAANQQRQVEIRRDTEKMAALMQELRDYLATSDQGVVSVDAIKKAEQIEKLAHSIKLKMKQSF